MSGAVSYLSIIESIKKATQKFCIALWLRQESNLDLRLRRPEYYPLYYEAGFRPANIRFILNQGLHNRMCRVIFYKILDEDIAFRRV